MIGREKVLGTQACCWTEWMPNENRVEYMIYPRLFALAEVAWSNLNEHRDYTEFRQRAKYLCDWAKNKATILSILILRSENALLRSLPLSTSVMDAR